VLPPPVGAESYINYGTRRLPLCVSVDECRLKGASAVQVTLNETELELLVSLLRSEVGHVRSEVYRAESHDVKVLLKEREAIINRIIDAMTTVHA
jgi:hypothetical protein